MADEDCDLRQEGERRVVHCTWEAPVAVPLTGWTTTLDFQSRAVVIHEFGHAFGGLADEYFNSAVAYSDYFPLDVEPWNPNLTTLVDFGRKWGDLIQDGTPVPTPPDDQFLTRVGVYEGGGYVAKGVFRPMIDCLMHSNEATFCPVCQRAILQMIKRYTTH